MGCRGSQQMQGETHVDLVIWLPAMFFLGLVIFALMFAFVPACDKV